MLTIVPAELFSCSMSKFESDTSS